jgi:hypothetical protein
MGTPMRTPRRRLRSNRAVELLVLVMMSATLLGWNSGVAGAEPPTRGLVKAPASIQSAVVRAINVNVSPSRPASCIDVWVTKSSSQWATWTFSKSAYTKPQCSVVDAYREFFRNSGGKWKWAGRFSGVQSPACFFAPRALPKLQIQRDLGCA